MPLDLGRRPLGGAGWEQVADNGKQILDAPRLYFVFPDGQAL